MPRNPKTGFNMAAFLLEIGEGKSVLKCRRKQIIFAQGNLGDSIFYIQKGRVKLTVISEDGKEGVVGLVDAGDFFGEGCLAGQARRLVTATALEDSVVDCLPRKSMQRMLNTKPEFSAVFIHHLITRNAHIQGNLADLLFNTSERRLARTLLLLSHIGKVENFDEVIPKISHEVLAEMIGTTRSRVSYFMNKFRKMGFIDYNGGLKIHSSLLNVVLHGSTSRKSNRPKAH
ncbi:MAG: Crp/Fnr family transcriptional regulator [Terriglobia bacterium]